MARWGRPLLRCTASVVCAEGVLPVVGVFKTSDQLQKGPSTNQAHHQILFYISTYANIYSYCPCRVAWHAKHPFGELSPVQHHVLSSFDFNFKFFFDIYQAVPLQIGAHGKRKRAGTAFGLAHYPSLCFHRGVA